MTQKFHAHIYFELVQQNTAEALYLAIHNLMLARVRLGQFHLRLVGPHSLPMFTVMFEASQKNEFIQFLNRNHAGLSVLIHEDTGDDYRDHTRGVEWLGNPLTINFEHFERIKHDRGALVFPEQ
jgi:aromatic ring-cleaving dioxygenase